MNYSKLVGSIFSLILNYVSTTWHSHNNVSTWLPVPSFIFWNNSFLVSTKTWQRLCADVTRLARLHAECKFRFRQWYKDLWCLCCRCLTNLRAFMFIRDTVNRFCIWNVREFTFWMKWTLCCFLPVTFTFVSLLSVYP